MRVSGFDAPTGCMTSQRGGRQNTNSREGLLAVGKPMHALANVPTFILSLGFSPYLQCLPICDGEGTPKCVICVMPLLRQKLRKRLCQPDQHLQGVCGRVSGQPSCIKMCQGGWYFGCFVERVLLPASLVASACSHHGCKLHTLAL